MLQMSDLPCRFKRSMQHPLRDSSDNTFQQARTFGLSSIRPKQDGVFFESTRASGFDL